jgi:hypothetical protein
MVFLSYLRSLLLSELSHHLSSYYTMPLCPWCTDLSNRGPHRASYKTISRHRNAWSARHDIAATRPQDDSIPPDGDGNNGLRDNEELGTASGDEIDKEQYLDEIEIEQSTYSISPMLYHSRISFDISSRIFGIRWRSSNFVVLGVFWGLSIFAYLGQLTSKHHLRENYPYDLPSP